MTIKDIAKLSGVSIATVSKIINKKDQHISEKTRSRVLGVINKEGYVPNGIAKSLKMKKTKSIGLIMPDIMNPLFAQLARGVEDAAEKKGYSVILCNTDNQEQKEEKYINILKEKMVDGIIMTASEGELSNAAKGCDIPIVLADRDVGIGATVLLAQSEIDGVCCGNDLIVIGAIKWLQDNNIKVLQKIKVIGFDDIYVARYMNPPLTTIRRPIYELGENLVKMLVKLICKKDV